MPEDSKDKKRGLGDILDGLSGLLELVNKIQESGEQGITRSGEFTTDSGVKGKYGVQFKAAGGTDPGVESFEVDRDTLGQEEPAQRSSQKRERSHREFEPFVDVIEQEDDTITIVAELPGVNPDSIQFESDGDELELFASGEDRTFRKALTLPYQVRPEAVDSSYVNGIFSVVFHRDGQT